jgi:dienelactone hydrolase
MGVMAGTRVEIKTRDGIADAHVFVPGGSATGPGVLLYMDGIGVRDALFAMAEQLAGHGYCVLLPGFAIAAAGTYPDPVLAAASFHGARLATDAPNSPHLLAPRMRARLYIGVADNDAGHPPEATEKLEAAFDAAGVRHQIELYPGSLHGWVPSDTPVHDQAATARRWQRLFALLDETLKG